MQFYNLFYEEDKLSFSVNVKIIPERNEILNRN